MPARERALRRLFCGSQIARAFHVAVQSGVYPPHQGVAAMEAAELVRYEMRRVVAVMTGNSAYWGLPDVQSGPRPRRGRLSVTTPRRRRRRRSASGSPGGDRRACRLR